LKEEDEITVFPWGSPERKAIMDTIRSRESFAGKKFHVFHIAAKNNYCYVIFGIYSEGHKSFPEWDALLKRKNGRWDLIHGPGIFSSQEEKDGKTITRKEIILDAYQKCPLKF